MSQAFPNTRGPVCELDRLVRAVDEISSLPHVALRVMEVGNDPNSSAADLKQVTESDAALSARVLRCVNSSAYATRVKITNLQQAIAYLGMKQVRNLAMTASVSELFKEDQAIGCYRRLALWRHLVSVGVCSRLIAMRCGVGSFEDAFLAGLLHDVGIVLEDQYAHDSFCTVIESLDKGKTLAETERDCLGFDHTEFGEKVARLWKFPEVIRAAICHHHGSVGYRGESIDVVRCVEIANLLCTLKGITSVGHPVLRVSKPALMGLSLTKQDIQVLAEDLDEELATNASLFQMQMS
ncbi:MAG: HDOD domain-containing protein [Pirellulales bacterium]|nr:HDOD domain-containing protein [Pirellulales bacterium]